MSFSLFMLGLLGFRLSATVLEVRNVSSRIACIDECLEEPCCRSINYEHISSPDQWNKCEFLHHLFENTSFALVANSSFDHVFVINPPKVTCLKNCVEFKIVLSDINQVIYSKGRGGEWCSISQLIYKKFHTN